MKKWAVLTVFLYAIILLVLAMPMAWLAFSKPGDGVLFSETWEIFHVWLFWVWVIVLITGQALLLLLPIDISQRRLTPRRPLKLPIIVSAFFLANLCFAGFFSLVCAAFKDNGFAAMDPAVAFRLIKETFQHIEQPQGEDNSSMLGFFLGAISIIVIFWGFWGMLFYRSAKADEPDALMKRITRWLLRGSILELLVAVPSHIIVRRRDDCCAPMGTFWGITTGISIMLLCFGPGVYFLFVERIQRAKPKSTSKKTG